MHDEEDEECTHEVRTYEVDVREDGQCCERMVHFLRADDLPVIFSPKIRRWAIAYPGDNSSQEIHFCPWCGAKLPSSLSDEWYRRIDALGLDPEDDEIPEPMRTDRWWRDEGL